MRTSKFKVIIVTCDIETVDPEPPCISRYLTPQLAKSIVDNYRLAQQLELPSPERLGRHERFYAWVPKAETGDRPAAQ
jgi:hypothetical protein